MINYKIKIQTKKLIRGKQLWNYYFTFYLVFSHWMYFFFQVWWSYPTYLFFPVLVKSSLLPLALPMNGMHSSNYFLVCSLLEDYRPSFLFNLSYAFILFLSLLQNGQFQELSDFHSWHVKGIFLLSLFHLQISPFFEPSFFPLCFFFSQQNMVYKVFLVYYF